jgi:NAD-specific glutamate dehydrogenase
VPTALAARIARLESLRQAFDLADKAKALGASVEDTARAVGTAAEYLGIDELEARAAAMEPADEFDTRAAADSLSTIRAAHTALADRILREASMQDIGDWARQAMPGLIQPKTLIDRIIAEQGISVARLAVVASALKSAGLASGQAQAASPQPDAARS